MSKDQPWNSVLKFLPDLGDKWLNGKVGGQDLKNWEFKLEGLQPETQRRTDNEFGNQEMACGGRGLITI